MHQQRCSADSQAVGGEADYSLGDRPVVSLHTAPHSGSGMQSLGVDGEATRTAHAMQGQASLGSHALKLMREAKIRTGNLMFK